MRAIRVECAFDKIENDPRGQASLSCISWDFRSTLGFYDGRMRILCECITLGKPCPPPGFSIGGITMLQILEAWEIGTLRHHLVVLEFSEDLLGRHFDNKDMAILAGTNLTSKGMVIQLAGRQELIMGFIKDLKGHISVDRITTGRGSIGMVESGPTLQQLRILKTAHHYGWYETPKRISIRGLAEKMGLSKSAVAEQLVKAEGTVIGDYIDSSS